MQTVLCLIKYNQETVHGSDWPLTINIGTLQYIT